MVIETDMAAAGLSAWAAVRGRMQAPCAESGIEVFCCAACAAAADFARARDGIAQFELFRMIEAFGDHVGISAQRSEPMVVRARVAEGNVSVKDSP